MFVRIRKRPSKLWADTSLEVILVKNRRVGPKFKQECRYLGCIRLSRVETSNRKITFWRKVRGILNSLDLPEDARKSIEGKILTYVPMPEEMKKARKYKVPRGFSKRMNLALKRLR